MLGTVANVILAIGRKNPAGVQLLGTGFAVTASLIATAAHVTGPADQDLCVVMPRIKNLEDYQNTTDQQVNLIAVKIAKYDPIRDIAILAAVEAMAMSFSYTLAGTDAALAGGAVTTLGFPHADHGRLILTQQRSHVGARIILGSQGIRTKHIILNVQAKPGQSGSPVFIEEEMKVVAMVIGSYAPEGGGGVVIGGIDPQTLHQTTHALSAEYITDLLK